jgi:hypothetical protein
MTGEIHEIVHDVPPDLISFIGIEHEQVLRTHRIDPEDMHFVDHIGVATMWIAPRPVS